MGLSGNRATVAPQGPPPRDIVVAQTGFLGDVVLTTPLLRAIRDLWPGARVVALVTPQAAPLLRGHAAVDEVWEDDKRGRHGGPAGLLRLAAELRPHHVDLALAPHRSLRTALLLALARIPRRVGFRESPGWWLYHARERRNGAHAAERTLALLRSFGVRPERWYDSLELSVAPGAVARAEVVLREHALAGDAEIVGIAPGSAWRTKRWLPEGFAAVAREIAARRGARVAVFGGSEDRELCAAVARASGNAAVSLAGAVDLPTFIACLDRVAVLITNDSAPMHMAAARGRPVVAVFCATVPEQGFGPYGTRAVVVQSPLDCRPCGRHGGRTCPRGTEDCRHLVTPAQVLRAVWTLLGESESVKTGQVRA